MATGAAIDTVSLLVNSSKWEALQFAQEAIAYLTERDVRVLLDSKSAAAIGRDDIGCNDEDLCQAKLIITLGGDGTILAASHLAAPLGIPVLGVHMGRFGFIAEAHPADLVPNLDILLEGRLRIEERMMV